MDGTIFNDIADELVLNILVRLPVKSLKRFSCVNKWWYNLIHNPYFISRHYSHHSSGNQKLLVKSSPSNFNTGQEVICFLSENDGDSSHLSTPFLNQDHKVTLIGPCINGIICLKLITSLTIVDVALWNVATGEYIILPRLDFSIPPRASIDPVMEGIGFGWIPETNEYKVVIGIEFWHDSPSSGYYMDGIDYKRDSEFYRYTLGTNSWKQLSFEIPFCPSYLKSDPPFHSQIYVDGICYWVGSTYDKIYKIFSFHVRDEVFGTLQLPYIEIPHPGSLYLTLFMLDGCIALVNNRSDPGNFHFLADIWVMEGSWIKKFKIGPLSNIQTGLGLVKDEYFLEHESGHLLSININSQLVKNLGIRGDKYSIEVLEYVESLVQSKGDRNFIILSKTFFFYPNNY